MTDPSTTPTHALCVLGDPDRPHGAHIGLLCDPHLQRLSSELREAETLTVELSARPAGTPYRSPNGGGGRGTGLASQRSVLDLERESLVGRTATAFDYETADPEGRDETPNAVELIGYWATMVRDARRLTDPVGTLVEDRRLLTRHLDWVAAQPAVVQFAVDLGILVRALRRATGTTRQDDGPCPRIVGDGPCTGRIRRARGTRPWLLREDRCELVALDDIAAGALHCPVCGASWPTEADEARLRVMLADAARDALRPRTTDGRAMVTARELAERTGLTLRSVQLRLHRAGITPVLDEVRVGWYSPDAIIVGPAAPAAPTTTASSAG